MLLSKKQQLCSIVSELAGPKCLIEGSGFIQPFFPAQIRHRVRLVNYYTVLSRSTSVRVGLPCRYSPQSVDLHFCDHNVTQSDHHHTDYTDSPFS